jgi:hypothetical protein
VWVVGAPRSKKIIKQWGRANHVHLKYPKRHLHKYNWSICRNNGYNDVL